MCVCLTACHVDMVVGLLSVYPRFPSAERGPKASPGLRGDLIGDSDLRQVRVLKRLGFSPYFSRRNRRSQLPHSQIRRTAVLQQLPPQSRSPSSKPVLRPSFQSHQTHHLHLCVGTCSEHFYVQAAWGWSLGLGRLC